MFGLDTTFGQTNALIPFVHAPAISLERMSADPAEGWHTNGLPHALVAMPVPPLPGGVVGGMLDPMANSAAKGAGAKRKVPVLRVNRKRG